jgi:ferredoxin-NADP reductase
VAAKAGGQPVSDTSGLPGSGPVPPDQGRVMLLASATGTGPLRAVLAALPDGTVTVIYRTAAPADARLKDELHALAAANVGRVYYLPGDGSADAGPLARAAGLIPVPRRHDVYLSGPASLAAAAVRALCAAGIAPDRIRRSIP